MDHILGPLLEKVGGKNYGAFATPYFILYNQNVAGTITAEGRKLTKTMSDVNEDYWYNIWHTEKELHSKLKIKNVKKIKEGTPVSVYGDSVDGETNIDTDNGSFKIKDLWETQAKNIINSDNKEVLPVSFKSLNWTEESGVIYSKVKNIIRHKTTKKKWKLKAGGKEVIITNDHSLIVFREGVKVTVKPGDIKTGDKILTIENK